MKIPIRRAPRPSPRRGMTMPIVLLAVLLLGCFAFYFHQYRQTQIQMSSTIGKFYNALAVAEAGVAAAITEMATNFEWKTHRTSGAPGDTRFDAPIAHDNAVRSGGALTSVSGTNGTYSGRIGSLGEFKVRVGLEQVAGDNPRTKTANEQYMFYRIESVGRYGDTYQKVSVVLKKRIISEEYLLFDNDFLDMVLGVDSPNEGDNVFSIGSLYGRRFVYLGTIASNKPRLGFRDVSNISTAGELYVWDTFVTINNQGLDPNRNSSTTNFKINNAGSLVGIGAGANFWGDFVVPGKPNADFAKNSLDVLKDGANGGKLEVLNFEEIFPNFAARAAAGGIVVTSAAGGVGRPDTSFENPYPAVGKPKDLLHLDFGDMGDGDACLGAGLSASFNGILYSTVPLRIRGCPDRDMVIVSDEDIYICGDFNQASSVIQAYKDENLIEYEVNPLTGKDYFAEDKQYRVDNPNEKHGLVRNRCKVMSKGKVWYDYTRPDYIYKNELKGLIEYELVKLLTDEGEAKKAIQDLTGSRNVVATGNGPLKTIQMNAAKTDDELLALTKTVDLVKYLCTKPTAQRTQANAAPRTQSIYASEYGADTSKAEDFLKRKLKVKEAAGESDMSFLDMARDGRLTAAERKALVDALWEGLEKSVEADGEESAIWDMPQRLFDLTKPGGRYSQFSGTEGTLDERKKDKLMIPEFTINAKVITGDARNGLWKIGKTSRAIYNELGNPDPSWSLPRSAGYFRYVQPTSAILRLLGGEIHLRLRKREPVTTGSVYQPNIRKKVFDVELMGFEDETAIPSYSVVSFTHTKVAKKDFDSF